MNNLISITIKRKLDLHYNTLTHK